MAERKLTFEAMKEDGWNAVALPIPVDASAELLMEIHSWAGDRAQVYGDALQGERYGFKEEQEPREVQRQKLRMAQMRIVQSEWRLNVLGLFHEFGGWTPPQENRYVQPVIKRMAEPGNYEEPAWRPYGFGGTVPNLRESPSLREPKRDHRNRLTRLWHRMRGHERS